MHHNGWLLRNPFSIQMDELDLKAMRKGISDPWEEANEGIKDLTGSIESLLLVILVIGAIVTLAYAIGKMMKGDRDSAERVMLWFAGFLIGSIFLGIVL